jgi:hypothetical protein
MLQAFFICENLVAQYMHQFHHRSVPRYALIRKMGIYVGYHFPSIIKYMERMTEDLFTARSANFIFDEDHFPALGGEFQNNSKWQKINRDDKSIISSDTRT